MRAGTGVLSRGGATTRGLLRPGVRGGVCLLSIGLGLLLSGCSEPPGLVVYCAQDQVYAEPILHEFERRTGVKIGAVYDSEAVKTVGLANRLLAERHHPRADLFWGNEEMRTRQLARQGIFRSAKGWAAMGYRSRRIIVNTNLLPVNRAPKSWLDLTNANWRGKIAFAYPLFGTTVTHFLALKQAWGEELWLAWCRALVANEPLMVDGNSVTARMVATGEAWLGMTDSDDVRTAQRNGGPVAMLPLTEYTLLIPNTVGVVRGAKHAETAQQLFEFLRTSDVVRRLVSSNALEGLDAKGVLVPTLDPDWEELLDELDEGTEQLREVFLR